MRCPTLTELPLPLPGKTGWPWTEESPQLPDTMPCGEPCPRVSIVTPSYNQAQFIEETIRSVLLQGYPNLEYIIIDGGSTDGSVDIIRKYEPWLAYWVSEKDRGQSHAINKGFARARGEFVGWLNSDDYYTPGAVCAAVNAFRQYLDIAVVYGDCHSVDVNSRLLHSRMLPDFDLGESIVANFIAQPAAFFRRQALQRVHGVKENLNYVMDFDLWIRLGLESKFYHLPVFLACARDHGDAKSDQPWTFIPEIEAVYEELFARSDLPPVLAGRKAEAFFRTYSGYARWSLRVGQPLWAKALMVKAIASMPDFAHRPAMREWLITNASPLESIWDAELVQMSDCLTEREGQGLGHLLRAKRAHHQGRPLVALGEWGKAVHLTPAWALTAPALKRAVTSLARFITTERGWQYVSKYGNVLKRRFVRERSMIKYTASR